MARDNNEIHINPQIEPQIESELHDEKKADAYDPGTDRIEHVDHDDLEQGRLKVFEGSKHQDVIPDSVDPNFVRREEVRRGLSQRHIQVRDVLPQSQTPGMDSVVCGSWIFS